MLFAEVKSSDLKTEYAKKVANLYNEWIKNQVELGSGALIDAADDTCKKLIGDILNNAREYVKNTCYFFNRYPRKMVADIQLELYKALDYYSFPGQEARSYSRVFELFINFYEKRAHFKETEDFIYSNKLIYELLNKSVTSSIKEIAEKDVKFEKPKDRAYSEFLDERIPVSQRGTLRSLYDIAAEILADDDNSPPLSDAEKRFQSKMSHLMP